MNILGLIIKFFVVSVILGLGLGLTCSCSVRVRGEYNIKYDDDVLLLYWIHPTATVYPKKQWKQH